MCQSLRGVLDYAAAEAYCKDLQIQFDLQHCSLTPVTVLCLVILYNLARC